MIGHLVERATCLCGAQKRMDSWEDVHADHCPEHWTLTRSLGELTRKLEQMIGRRSGHCRVKAITGSLCDYHAVDPFTPKCGGRVTNAADRDLLAGGAK